ncbi:MAG: enoyl-CoA hydratase/isomerase family protein [Acidimicrobiales bacterium]
MDRRELTIRELALALVPGGVQAVTSRPGSVPVLLLDAEDQETDNLRERQLHTGVGALVVGISEDADPDPRRVAIAPWCDVIVGVGSPQLAAIEAAAEDRPIASLALAMLLRGAAPRSEDDGLLAESATYSALQAGPEFTAWLRSRPPSRRAPDAAEPIHVERVDDGLRITLTRPHVRNALDRAMRDRLLEALSVIVHDESIRVVELVGQGPAYSSGGDLDEFGTFPDPASAHVTRLQASIGRVVSALRERVTVRLHGTCYGSGIELPAFAGHVVARPDVDICLPELMLGLVPGAGGTVSITRRIGRHRTARLVLTGEHLRLDTAVAWRLVDAADAEPT